MSLQEQQNNKRIAKNTLLLYFRMLITMAVGLYTSRILLQNLGVEDFGIYNVVGGVIAMLGDCVELYD
jgi:O-antigen/teichoic acid export membrane protein